MRNKLKLPPDSKPSVYIIDDDDDVRASVECLVDSMGFVSNSFESAESFLDKTETDICGCVLTDLRLMGCNGIELIKEMKTVGYHVPVIIVSGFLDVALTVNALSEGAFSVLDKPYLEQKLRDSLIAAIKYDSEYREIRLWIQGTQEKISSLSHDEKAILGLLLNGKSNTYIAHTIELPQRTIEICRKTILEKFEVENLIELAMQLTKLQFKQRQFKLDNGTLDLSRST